MIVSSNRVEVSTESEVPAIALFVDAANDKQLPHCTVLGNISSRLIWLNDAPLGGPWKPLNIVA